MLVIGAGGNTKVVIELVRATGAYEIIGLIDLNLSGPPILGVPIFRDVKQSHMLLLESGTTNAACKQAIIFGRSTSKSLTQLVPRQQFPRAPDWVMELR